MFVMLTAIGSYHQLIIFTNNYCR